MRSRNWNTVRKIHCLLQNGLKMIRCKKMDVVEKMVTSNFFPACFFLLLCLTFFALQLRHDFDNEDQFVSEYKLKHEWGAKERVVH